MIRKLIGMQRRASKWFDGLLPKSVSVDGNMDFRKRVVPLLLPAVSGGRVVDVGSGRHPFLSAEEKASLAVTVVGLDISREELVAAPLGSYDEIVTSDIALYQGEGNADLVICQSVLEHVSDVESAFQRLSSMLKNDGILVTFCPSRNAIFARINLLVPQQVKERLLHAIFPETVIGYGFPVFYDKCTPQQFERIALENGLVVEQRHCYFKSSYFSFFLPFHVAYRLWNIFAFYVLGMRGAETFAFVFRKAECPERTE